jgi:hypothetical protein
MPTIIFERIKSEARNWVVAGCKALGSFHSGRVILIAPGGFVTLNLTVKLFLLF